MTFPPKSSYPRAIDSDYTLFLVYNTTETKLCSDNAAWSQEIEIIPVLADKPDIWANNGFANIDGELLYYDDVEFNGDGKVNKLKKCARNLGGEHTKFNPRGTWIRSFVVAEHHNQMVDAILQTENFIGYNFDPRRPTLDWKIEFPTSNKFFDYIAAGIPVVCNYPGWLAELIVAHQCGLVVKPRDVVGFAQAICQLADNRAVSRAMGFSARRLAEVEFDRQKLAERFIMTLERRVQGS